MEFKKDSIITTYDEQYTKRPSTRFEVINDSVNWVYKVAGIEVFCSLKIDNEKAINGKAVWSSGETLLYLEKIDNTESK